MAPGARKDGRSSQTNNQIQFILTQFYLKKSLIENPISEPDPFDKDPPRDARSFRQSSSDVLGIPCRRQEISAI